MISAASFFARPSRSLLLLTLLVGAAPWSLQAAKPNKAELKELKRDLGADAVDGKISKRDDKPAGRPEASDAASRMMTKLREQLEVTDETEWALISERINQVSELRRNLASSAGGKVAPVASDKAKRAGRAEGSMQAEQAALRAAVRDKLPDAEVKARLTRVHEVYQQNEARLAKAQADLRAVLTIRQEAVAVMAGLLTP